MFINRGFQKVASDFSISNYRFKNSKQLKTVSPFSQFARNPVEVKNFQERYCYIFWELFIPFATLCLFFVLLFIRHIKMDVKLAALVVLISVICVVNAKPMDVFRKYLSFLHL